MTETDDPLQELFPDYFRSARDYVRNEALAEFDATLTVTDTAKIAARTVPPPSWTTTPISQGHRRRDGHTLLSPISQRIRLRGLGDTGKSASVDGVALAQEPTSGAPHFEEGATSMVFQLGDVRMLYFINRTGHRWESETTCVGKWAELPHRTKAGPETGASDHTYPIPCRSSIG